MANTATRLITLIMLLQRQPNQKGTDLAKELDVSVRTLQRYIAMLNEMGIPVYAERGPFGGYSLVRGYKMPPLVLTPSEAVAVYLGTSLVEEMWGKIYMDDTRCALSKLENLLPDEQLQEIAWAKQTLLAKNMHRSDNENLSSILEKLRIATRSRHQVRILYRSRKQIKSVHRKINPIALVHRWGWWYIVGYCHLRDAVRSFRVDRIKELTILDSTFNIPDNFDIQQYLDTEPHTQHNLNIRLQFSPDGVLMALDDSSMWKTMEEKSDGSLIVTMAVPSIQAATRIVMNYAPLCIVLEPDELRIMVNERARAILSQYSSGQ